MSVFAYLVKLARLLLAAGLFATFLLGETAHGEDARVAEAKKDYAEAEQAVASGHLAEAREALLSALKLVPRYADAEYLLGVVYARSERWQEAVEHYEKSLAIGPPQAKHHYSIGVCQRALGDTKMARASLEKAHALAESGVKENPGHESDVNRVLAEIDYNLACLARDEGDDNECKKRLELGLSEDPGGVKSLGAKLLAEKGALLLRTGDAEGAVKALEKALEATPDDLPALYKLGRALVAAGREAEGKAKLERYEKLDAERREKVNEQRRKDQAEALAQQAEAALKEGRKEEARALARKAYTLDPSNATARTVLEATQ